MKNMIEFEQQNYRPD